MKERGLNQSQSSATLQRAAAAQLNKSEDFGQSRPFSATGASTREFANKSTSQLPDINASMSMGSPSKNHSSHMSREPSAKELSGANSQMVKELAMRATT